MQLILISPPQDVPNEAGLAIELLDQGLSRFHVRKPAWSRAEVAAYLDSIPAHYHPQLVLHSHYSLATELGLGGVHLTAARRHQGTRPTLRPGQTLSTSFHTLAEIREHRRHYNYVFLSPIFDSLSKSDYPAAFALAEITATLGQLRHRAGYAPQVLALGGVDAARLPAVQQAGFVGAAVLGAVWQSPDPVAAFRELQSIIG
ncbi:thiamine phosphate synthase [Hymenobacter sp. B1770]|uniref:thiamine phosphate synthase n=1 Tax=Hymenobacter sp. B1770 TaxID=1718788 RepID=UPI003CE96456